MADVTQIKIVTKMPGNIALFVRQALIWGYLVGAEAASHLLFGGSWIIDLMVLASLILIVTKHATQTAGMAPSMTKAEIRLWVAAGMPNDIAAWRAGSKVSVVEQR